MSSARGKRAAPEEPAKGWARRLLRRPSRLALRIYAIGLVQFLVVAAVIEIEHRAHVGPPARSQDDARPPPPPPGDERGPPEGHGPPPGPPFALLFGLIVVVVGVGSWLTARSLARPLVALAATTRAFGKGALDVRLRLDRNDEIGEVAQAFDDMADQIASLLLAERELLANVSHELRTPLARIHVALDLASEADPSSGAVSLGEIAQDLGELERIVDDVLASARISLEAGPRSGGLPMRAESTDLRVILERSVARFRAAHPDRSLVAELPETLGDVIADAVLLRRVFDNLLDNAHKYTSDPSRKVTLEARLEPTEIVVEVIDEGVGIRADDQRRLFEPFFRVDRSRSRATGGLGLGLALARKIVVSHGGTLAIASEVKKGTRATVRLPRDDG